VRTDVLHSLQLGVQGEYTQGAFHHAFCHRIREVSSDPTPAFARCGFRIYSRHKGFATVTFPVPRGARVQARRARGGVVVIPFVVSYLGEHINWSADLVASARSSFTLLALLQLGTRRGRF